MTAENWSRVRSLVEGALEHPPEDRPGFLDLMCGDDAELRKEIEELLTLELQADSLFEENRWNLDALVSDALAPGTRVGAYRILDLIGEGGMGSVYLAERADAAYSQRVAIKVVQRGFGSSDLLERFKHERQTLARLNHPGIARLLDGGVAIDGRPYLVMEYVEGRLVNRYCDEEKLAVRERIALVIRICDAVQSAHQNLVIHRDLKPGNILVTESGEAKLLDFGIAKWLDADQATAAQTVQMLTPSYASPEQACHEPVSTATDVYSLGALLFELLTGSLPHDLTGLAPHEAIRRVSESTARLVSEVVSDEAAELRSTTVKALRRTLVGDLDTILQQALRREPSRRYPTVQAFSADLQRYLDELPVKARPDTWLYRANKLVRRRTATVVVAAASVVAICLALAGVWRGYAAAQAQRNIAERRYENGRTLVQSYLTEVDRKLEGMPGTAAVRGLIAQRNLEYLDRMTADAKGDIKLERELAQAYFLIGRTQRMRAQSAADRERARAQLDKAVQFRRMIFNTTHDIVDRGQLAYLLAQAGGLLVQSGKLREAIAYHQEACQLAQPIFAASPKGLNYLRAANACWNLATDYIGNEQAPFAGRFEEGLKGQLETLARFERWRDANPENAMGYPYVASMESMTAGAYWRLGRYRDAKQHFESALAILHGPHGLLSHDLSMSYLTMAEMDYSMMLVDSRQFSTALPHAEEALALARKQMAAQGGADPGWQCVMGLTEVAAGRTLVFNGKQREGLALVLQGLTRLRPLHSQDPSDAEMAGALSQSELWAIDAERVGRASERVAEHAREVIALATAALQQDPEDAAAETNLRMAEKLQAGN